MTPWRSRAVARLTRPCLAALALVLAGAPAPASAAGVVREFVLPTPDSHPTGITLGPDGAMWFANVATNRIARLGPGGITEFTLPQGGNPNAVTVGPDGALWFTETAAGRIGRITTAGAITEFPVPACAGCRSGEQWDIATGPDGALWFTEYEAGRIGRVTTAGRVTQFPLGHRFATPLSIAAGPDGALWFTHANGVARITTGGRVSHVWTGSSPLGIGTGSEGSVWFTGQDAVGRIDPATGATRLFPTHRNCFPQEIEAAAGAMWFACYFLDEVGRVDASGAITSFPVPNHFGGTYPDTIEGVTAGAAGTVWFTEEAANRVGRLDAT